MINHLKDERGQILPFAALTLLALVMFWMTVVNVGKLVRDRIMLQNAADAAAQSAACYQARGLNFVNLWNIYIGSRLICCLFVKAERRPQIRGLIRTQDSLKYMFNRFITFALADRIARENGADGLHWMSIPLISDLELKRNRGLIIWWTRICIPFLGCFRIPWPIERRGKKWLEIDKEKFNPKATVIVYKDYEDETFFPIGKNLLGITEMPPIYAIASARPYNRRNRGYPKKNQWRGLFGFVAIWEWILGLPGYDAHLIPVGFPFQH